MAGAVQDDAPGRADAGNGRASHGALFWVLSTLAAVALLVTVGIGAFLVGRGSRPSDQEVSSKLAAAADAARVNYGKREQASLVAQRTELRAQFRKKMKKAVAKAQDRGYASGQQVGYSSGQAAGYSSGSAEGKEEGKEEGKKQGLRVGRQQGEVEGYLTGFDDGTCYDPDTYEYVC